MLSIPGKQSRLCDGLSRREFIRVGGSAMLGISLPQILALEAKASNNVDAKIFFFLSILKYKKSLTSYSKSSQEPLFGITLQLNKSLPLA